MGLQIMLNNDERRGLLKFVPPNFLPIPVLLIDSAELLTGLRKLLPAAQIFFMTTEPTPKVERLCAECRVILIDDLPSEPKIFELIIAPEVLTTGENFYATLMTFNHLLQDSGALLTQFLNVRFIGVLENLRRGRFSSNERRLWAKADVVKLLDDAIYKEIHFLPDKTLVPSPQSLVPWQDFDNFNDDLTTKIWLVKACKCTAEVAALKDIFTPETRAELSRLLHRIEYDIDAEENFSLLIELCDREGIFDEYLRDFINQVVVHAPAKNFIRDRAENFGRVLNFDY